MHEKTASVTYVPFKRTDYQLRDALSPEERDAISTGYRRSAALGQLGALPFLLLPLRDIASRSSISARLVRITLLELETFMTELLWRGQNCHDRGIARVTGKISYALAAMGIIKSPLRMRNYKEA